MRQAGRYLPEYGETKEKAGGFLSLCFTPEHAVEAMEQPLRRFDLDAAILFSDILTPLHRFGLDMNFNPGPVIENPIRSRKDLERFGDFVPERDVPYIEPILRTASGKLKPRQALIGFCGSPFTLMAYATTRKFSGVRESLELIRKQPELAGAILDLLADFMTAYLLHQIDRGAEVVQIFDSWAGALQPEIYREFAKKPAKRMMETIKRERPDVPLIYYLRGVSRLFEELEDMPFDCLSLDEEASIAEAGKRLGKGKALQGNLAPQSLFKDDDTLKKETALTVEAGLEHGRYVFNLGHGILKETRPEKVGTLLRFIREIERASFGPARDRET